MQKIWDFLDGRKRLIGGIIVFVGGGLRATQLVDEETAIGVIELGVLITAFGAGAWLQKRQK